jgi:ASC-1-like (ASCH) protein
MEHLAIMKKSWRLTDKILCGEKKIESRWYKSKYPPWDKIKEGEFIYFKDSGEPVSIKAEVEKVLQFSNLNPEEVKKILEEYGKDDGIAEDKIAEFFELFKDKNYCMLIFLKNPQKIEPFNINKKGFGIMSAWICVDDIDVLKVYAGERIRTSEGTKP